MDGHRFDHLSRVIASCRSRRQVLRLLAAAAAVGMAPRRAKAAQDGTPTPPCAAGQAFCSGVCVDTCCDNANCGGCGNTCTGGLTCFEGICDCPSGNCGPVTPPNTGAGLGNPADGPRAWAALAAAGIAAAIAARWSRNRATRPVRAVVEAAAREAANRPEAD